MTLLKDEPWFRRRCYCCGHRVRPPRWYGNELIVERRCRMCQRANHSWYAELTNIAPADDQFDLLEYGVINEAVHASYLGYGFAHNSTLLLLPWRRDTGERVVVFPDDAWNK